MATSTQLTDAINRSPNPLEAKLNIWKKTRYLVAQKPASEDYAETMPGYYKGRVVIPGPLANPKISEVLSNNDLSIVENRHHIRFVDNNTTENADEHVRRSNYTVMSKAEADDYEKGLKKWYKDNPHDQSKTVSGPAT